MSDLDNAIESLESSALKAENTATFLDNWSTYDDSSDVTNPNNGVTVPSAQKKIKELTSATAQGELKAIARSLNVTDDEVIYSTDTTTVLDNVKYIYDATEQKTYYTPGGVVGKFISSVAVGVLTTTDTSEYQLNEVVTQLEYTSDQFGIVGGLLTTDTLAIANTTTMQTALNAIATLGGGTLYCNEQYYTFAGDGIRIPQGVVVVGNGVGEWEPIYPTRAKTWEGTNFIFRGTGNKVKSFYGVTSMLNGGGHVTDSSSVEHSLTSFTNSDASGITAATQRTFSVAVGPVSGDHYWGLKNVRIVNWVGTDGISDHSNTSLDDLGADWDIGLLSDNSEYCDVENVQVVGYWREFGLLEITTAITESRSERNYFKRMKLQGRVAHGVRAPDRWAASATTDTVSITFSAEHYFPTSGSFRGSNNTTYTYTGLSYASPTLTFTGVSPNPTGIFQVRHPSTGFGNTEYYDIYSYSLNHVSGNDAAYFGLSDSKPLEISGFPLRGVKFRNYKCHTDEDTVFHIHDAQDITMIDPQFEGGGLLIASPVNSEGTAIAQVGETRNLVMIADSGTNEQDLELFLPRNGFIQSLNIGLRSDLSGDFILTPTRGDRDVVIQSKDGQNVIIRSSDNGDTFRVTDSGNVLIQEGGQLSFTGGATYINSESGQATYIRNGTTLRLQCYGASGNWASGADNTQAWGTSTNRWLGVYGSTFYPGAGTVKWTSGSGTPEGVLTAVVGSMYTRTDGGAGTTLYVKESGTGNTGWVAK